MKLTIIFKVKQVTSFIYLFISALLFSFPAFAQQPVTGKVTDSSGKPLHGVSVIVKGTNKGSVTNEEGVFAIVAGKGETLEISMVGYKNKSIAITDQTNYEINLQQDVNTLSEVVMIGYGSTQRKDAVGAINTVSGKNFSNSSGTQPAELLQGKAPGVQVVRRSGDPSSPLEVIIRGTGSFTSVGPLYIIDGIRSEAFVFNSIHPQDVESITILKDASSTAIYGANGANGVVIITTKKGRSGPPKISFSTQWGVAMGPKKFKLLNAAEYLDLAKEYVQYNNQDPQNPQLTIPPGFSTTNGADWQDEIFKTAVLSTNHISVSGGNEKVNYNISAGYTDQQSTLMNFRYKVANLRISLGETFGIFTFGQDINLQYNHKGGVNAGIRDALSMPPYLVVHDPTVVGGFTATNDKDLFNEDNRILNPVAGALTLNYADRNLILNPQFFGEVKILKSLTFRSQVSLKYTNQNLSEFQNSYFIGFKVRPSETEDQHFTSMGYLLENYATWKQVFGNKHHFTVTAGNSYIDKGRASLLVAEGRVNNNSVPNISVALDPEVHEATTGYANPSELSYFGRLQYGFDNRYILTASFRRDGSSVFGPGNKFGNFPAFGFAWNVFKEKFMEKANMISELKLRMSWGKTGNSNGEPFRTSQYIYSGYHQGTLIYDLGEGEENVRGTTINFFPNPLLKWEETTETDVGIDLGLFNNDLKLTVDWYKRANKDLLVEIPVPNSTGTGPVTGGGTILSNAASVVNKGIEAQLTYSKAVNKNFSYSVTLNGSYNQNKVISIGTEFLGQIYGGYVDDDLPVTITRAGDPIGSFYGYKIDHLDTHTGDFVFKDINKDGDINDLDKVTLGSPIPKFVYGGTIELRYRNFDFSMLITGVTGVKIYNQLNDILRGTESLHNVSVDLLNRWKKDGDIAKYPKAFENADDNLVPSDFYTENGSYMRAKQITLGYSLPDRKLKQMSNGIIKSFRFYISAENIFTITPYSGYDPEVSRINGDIIFSRGIDRGNWVPQPRAVLAGIQMNF